MTKPNANDHSVPLSIAGVAAFGAGLFLGAVLGYLADDRGYLSALKEFRFINDAKKDGSL